jgi:FlaA1/EpsC-like NDP-sugar epimerase
MVNIDRSRRASALEAALRRRFPLVQAVVDAGVWFVAVIVATGLRYDGRFDKTDIAGMLVVASVAAILQVLVGLSFGLYRRRYHYGAFDEVKVLAGVVVAVGVGLLFLALVEGGGWVPRSVPVIAASIALVLASAARFVARLAEDAYRRPADQSSEPLVVLGAGEAGQQITRHLLRSPDSPYRPVALLDDDPRKAQLRANGLRVQGNGDDAVAVAASHGATTVLVAIPSITGDRLRDVTGPMLDAGLRVLVLPPVADLLGTVRPADIRPLQITDLLGRHPANVDPASIADYVTGRRVLVTGAGGSIGSELCRQLRAFGPASLVLLDRDESGLHATQLSLDGRGLLDSPSLVVADIRDRDRLFQVFQQHRPEVVFHAAALKHLPLLQMHPSEAWKTNVVGTENLLEVAEATDVAVLVNISTDKAADPTSVLGYTKRICERLTAEAAGRTERRYVSVRFGNVLGSRGSMLTTFERQIEDGGPITVTHPDVTRYFMTVEEAVALTIQAGALGEPGEVLVLDMGKPVRIEDVARRLVEQSGRDVRILHSGLRPGEKLHEVLLGDGEVDLRPRHPLISQVPVPPLRFGDVRAACTVGGRLTVTPLTLDAAASWGLPDGEASAAWGRGGDERLAD